jgi:hypothetical protein
LRRESQTPIHKWRLGLYSVARETDVKSLVLSAQSVESKSILPLTSMASSCIPACFHFELAVLLCLHFAAVKVPTDLEQIWIFQTESPDLTERSPKSPKRFHEAGGKF